MKVNEVIVPKKHLFDILRTSAVVSFDRRYDTLAAITRNFTLPIEYFNGELVIEYADDAKLELAEMQRQLLPDSEWIKKANKMLDYLNGQ